MRGSSNSDEDDFAAMRRKSFSKREDLIKKTEWQGKFPWD